jgi:5-methylcytosine-specific restriction endonuclease McrA
MSLRDYQLWQFDRRLVFACRRSARHVARLLRRELKAARPPKSAEQKRAEFAAYMLARYHADPANWSSANKRRRIFERDDWRCRVCGKSVTDTVHRDHPRRAVAGHILAKATGGEWTDENMATLCYPCNVADGVNKIPIQTRLAVV